MHRHVALPTILLRAALVILLLVGAAVPWSVAAAGPAASPMAVADASPGHAVGEHGCCPPPGTAERCAASCPMACGFWACDDGARCAATGVGAKVAPQPAPTLTGSAPETATPPPKGLV